MPEMKRTSLLAIALVIVGLGSLFVTLAFTAYNAGNVAPYAYSNQPAQNQGWMMGGNQQGMMGMMAVQGQTIQVDQAIQMMRSTPQYADVIPSNNTIIFHGSQNIGIVALAIMPDRAINLTGMRPPSYSTGDVFVIDGLINPTLVVPAGASVQFTVVNLDDDMYHNLVVPSIGPPYPYMAMQGMMSSYDWMPFLPPADYNQGTAHEYSYSLTLSSPATVWYLCTYPGHAQMGMYGEIEVVNY